MTEAAKPTLFEVLIVDDNLADLRMIEEAFRDGNAPVRVTALCSGEEALDFLSGRGNFQNAPRPNLVLLDVALPQKSGLEVLVEIRDNPQLRLIPVIMLSSSSAQKDVNEAYTLNANCYVRKPSDWVSVASLVQVIGAFWFQYVVLPGSPTV